MREFADRFEPRLGGLRERAMRLIQEIRVRLVRAPSDAPAQLIELRETEAIGIVDDDRIDVWYVESVFDDGRRDEHVEAAFDEVDHDRLELALAHLPMPDADSRSRRKALHRRGDAVDRFDAIVDEVHLTTPVELGAQRLRDKRVARR